MRRRLALWLVLGSVLGLVAFSFLSGATSAGRVEFAPIDPSTPPELVAEIKRQNAAIEQQMAQLRDRYLWPWSLVQILGIGLMSYWILGLLGVAAVVFVRADIRE